MFGEWIPMNERRGRLTKRKPGWRDPNQDVTGGGNARKRCDKGKAPPKRRRDTSILSRQGEEPHMGRSGRDLPPSPSPKKRERGKRNPKWVVGWRWRKRTSKGKIPSTAEGTRQRVGKRNPTVRGVGKDSPPPKQEEERNPLDVLKELQISSPPEQLPKLLGPQSSLHPTDSF